jgi:hypothetical protein
MCLLPVHAITTPVHCTLPLSRVLSSTVISVHVLKGVALRNSIPLLRITTASWESESFACREATVKAASEPRLETFLALINSHQSNILAACVKACFVPESASALLPIASVCVLQIPGFYHSITAAPHVKPAPNTTNKIKSPRAIFPDETASSKAIATDAAEVLP